MLHNKPTAIAMSSIMWFQKVIALQGSQLHWCTPNQTCASFILFYSCL